MKQQGRALTVCHQEGEAAGYVVTSTPSANNVVPLSSPSTVWTRLVSCHVSSTKGIMASTLATTAVAARSFNSNSGDGDQFFFFNNNNNGDNSSR
mmetsp:Transcript_33204/g.37017  ORF Transcript_33204/g.37017 Transcript_33204/m.37017 type:complete len:95 (+) Transcript_33204:266-550(+)